MIMVIGGYGQVGGLVSRIVRNVIVAGRNIQMAKQFVKENKVEGKARYVDTQYIKQEDLKDVDCVVMCVESNNSKVLEVCIKNRIHYIDISPSYEILDEIVRRKSEVEAAGIRCILGVGIAPGISNLLCKEASKGFDVIDTVDSYLMLGLGEEHGANAIQWLLNHIYASTVGINSFAEKQKVLLHRESGNRKQTLTRIDLADWHIMQDKYRNAQCRSWFAYDVNWVTNAVCLMKKLGLFHKLNTPNMAKRDKANQSFQKLLQKELYVAKKLHIGTSEYITQVRVRGKIGELTEERTVSLGGYCNSEITAHVASYVANHIADLPQGLHFLDEVISIKELGVEYKVNNTD